MPASPVVTAETSLIFRLYPSPGVVASARCALVAAESEHEGRSIAVKNDPFGMDWKDPLKFKCDRSVPDERHAVGDVIFYQAT